MTTSIPAIRRLVLQRHGRTAWNLTGRAQGQTDISLDDVGRAQAVAAAGVLAEMAPVRLYSSDLARASETAAYLAEASGLDVVLDPRLREYDVGTRAGLTTEEFAERYPEEHDAWRAGNLAGLVPGAESTDQVLARMTPALREIVEATAFGATSVVVSHGACLKACILDLLGIDPEAARRIAGLDNACWCVLEDAGDGRGLRMQAWNRTASHDLAAAAPSSPL